MTAATVDVDFPRRLGQYEVIRELGRGGMARVFEAEHAQLKKRVAIKVLHSVLRGEKAAEARFVREGRAAARVRHLHVVEVFDVGVEAGVPFLVMEYLEGQTLAELLTARGSLPLSTVAEIFLPMISAVAAAHDLGLVHRDLKPQNVMLTLQGRSALHPVVLDFGISKVIDDDDVLTVSGTVLGTLHYLAPEQAHGAKFSSPQSDQYSLGVMLYECVTGQRPFSGEGQYSLMHAIVTAEPKPAEQLNPSLPAEFSALIRRAMRRSPELRYASVRELGRALLPFATPVVRARWAPELEHVEQRGIDDTAVSVEVLARPSQVGSTQLAAQPGVASSAPSRRSLLGGVVVAVAIVLLVLAWLDRRAREAPLEAVAKPPPAPATLAELPAPPRVEPAAPAAPVTVASAAPAEKPKPLLRPAARPSATLSARPGSPAARRETGTNNAPIIE